ncbi:MAG: hypothetical protein JSR42_12020 [Proteobacteria bacterium]|nr:hypothetical protein [Pseudomonadota bacterium]
MAFDALLIGKEAKLALGDARRHEFDKMNWDGDLHGALNRSIALLRTKAHLNEVAVLNGRFAIDELPDAALSHIGRNSLPEQSVGLIFKQDAADRLVTQDALLTGFSNRTFTFIYGLRDAAALLRSISIFGDSFAHRNAGQLALQVTVQNQNYAQGKITGQRA